MIKFIKTVGALILMTMGGIIGAFLYEYYGLGGML